VRSKPQRERHSTWIGRINRIIVKLPELPDSILFILYIDVQ